LRALFFKEEGVAAEVDPPLPLVLPADFFFAAARQVKGSPAGDTVLLPSPAADDAVSEYGGTTKAVAKVRIHITKATARLMRSITGRDMIPFARRGLMQKWAGAEGKKLSSASGSRGLAEKRETITGCTQRCPPLPPLLPVECAGECGASEFLIAQSGDCRGWKQQQ